MRLPKHIGIIPDGNRRWAAGKGLEKQEGYALGLEPGITLFRQCQELGIEEMSFYGFTADNAKRPSIQRLAFTRACVKAVDMLSHEDASLLVVGNTESAIFPKELLPYTTRRDFGKGGMKVNFLINYSPEWDLGPVIDPAGIPNACDGHGMYTGGQLHIAGGPPVGEAPGKYPGVHCDPQGGVAGGCL